MCSSPATPAIRAEGLSKCYQLYARPADRLRQLAWGRRHRYYREFWALREASFEVARGEVLGVVGRNGAGKSTLLQLVCGTLAPSAGAIAVNGRVAALLELGAGFNPEFSGRENVFLAASIMGLSTAEIEARFDQIVDFSGIRDFIEQPVKTYSSGMYVRLAFSVATSVDPDILVVDEALSVGDGEFARKSFDRIMAVRDAGNTILFCSHSMFQIESLCSRAIWIDQGRIVEAGSATDIVRAYQDFIDRNTATLTAGPTTKAAETGAIPTPAGHARLTAVSVSADGITGTRLKVQSGKTDLKLTLAFASDPALPIPSAAVVLNGADGRLISTVATWNDDVLLRRDADGRGQVTLTFPRLPLLKGTYTVGAYLMCERGLHRYDFGNPVATLDIFHDGIEFGIVSLPHGWEPG